MSNVIAFPARPRPYSRLPFLRRNGPAQRVTTRPRRLPRASTRTAWQWPAFTAFLPTGLPVGALTLIKVRAFAPGVMEEVVGDLIRSTTEAGLPCIYTPVNGAPHYPRVTEGAGAHLVTDEDVQASVVDTVRGVRDWYECGVPTLNIVPPKVNTIERDHGPAMLILDGIHDARPYNHSLAESETRQFGAHAALNSTGLNHWRAADLIAYARLRPEAPTVVVWHADLDGETSNDGLQALVDVSHVVIDRLDRREGPPFLISARDSIDEPLPYQVAGW